MAEDVKKEARELLDKFGNDLKKVDVKINSKISLSSDGLCYRDEEKGAECDEAFKTIMFKNAKHKDEECLILEKGSW